MPVVKEHVARCVPVGPIGFEHLDYTVHKLYVDQYSVVSGTACHYMSSTTMVPDSGWVPNDFMFTS